MTKLYHILFISSDAPSDTYYSRYLILFSESEKIPLYVRGVRIGYSEAKRLASASASNDFAAYSLADFMRFCSA